MTSNAFDIPRFTLENVREAIQDGILGENVQHITTEQLKNLTPSLMTDICKSFLEKIDFEVENLLVRGSAKYPEIYNNFFSSAVVLAQVTSHLIPGLNHPLECGNILQPNWSSVRSFLSWAINFCRFWNNYHEVLTDSMTKSEDLVASINAVQNENDKLERMICDIDVELDNNSELYETHRRTLAALQESFEEKQRLKEEKVAKKEEVKQKLMEAVQTLEAYDEQHQQCLEEEAKVKEGVVSSPGRQISESKSLNEKLELAKDEHLKAQDDVSERERKGKNMNQTLGLFQFTQEQVCKSIGLLEKIKGLEDTKLEMQCQNEATVLALQQSIQETNLLKEKISSHRQQLHRSKLRQQKKNASNKQNLKDLDNEIKAVEDKLQNKDGKMTKKVQELEKLQLMKKQRLNEHDEKMEVLKMKENSILHAFAQTESRASDILKHHEDNPMFKK